ncbi:MAG: SDR family NAD(P)-dependent oxidoreductase [Gammaproteobacteria bacterium]|jgi:short-subunit dehydrogenase|nr:oxidoreductase [Chromatiales bacterium]MCP4927171.1 SDR family NAD(P)-dependent oxidoreductase [Gammaproteobacteria bacterium]MDP7296071.1 SDR family NAD(P)-dependent oxidoreductase [Gammaproteobacteria bacterium]MDP7419093.1 SDR family NAD(P)-dependent oxidoreductase [Gammaproteobacteria bacterium]MDP7660499.1 SDR family NAD(P)-dependent oxidoreductase [Gammaproteobacteria bacterium]
MIIWITGASSGLGRELARQYAQQGHQVCASARSIAALNSLLESCRDTQGKIHVFALDVTDTARVSACFKRICSTVGMPDLCVLNAGTHIPNSAQRFDLAVFRHLMEINYMGVVNCLQAIVPVFIQSGQGDIAVVSSVAGYRGLPNASAYGASKAALINLCESLQPELAAAGVRLRLINPGFIRTPLTDQNKFPMPFLMAVEKAAARLIKGLDGRRFEITFPRRFTWLVKILSVLPYAVYLRLTSRLLKHD